MMADQFGQEPDYERQQQIGGSPVKRVFRGSGDSGWAQQGVRPDQRRCEGERVCQQLQMLNGEELTRGAGCSRVSALACVDLRSRS